ncbi:hypothetical protein CVT25_013049 [Psilocybe cyanescens]|uniref:Uncharacterized protein n=1 Tax=Psilocybe cyanescens TaxID=93625 RepID=A0A409X0S0_PSICY|nr:hypothetical protein CVT25_013049 [Psilocybe cyanescens]
MSSSISRPGLSPTISGFNHTSFSETVSSDFPDNSDSSSSSRTFISSANVNVPTFSQTFSSVSAVNPATFSPFPTATGVPLPPQSSSTSLSPVTGIPKAKTGSSSGLGQGEIALIATGSLLFLLGLAACIIVFLRRRHRRLSDGQSGAGSKSNGFEEKYADEAQYTPYSAYRKSLSDPGMAPLLRIPSIGQLSKIHSESDAESHLYQDGPLSPFTNEGESAPQTNAVSLAGAIPSRQSQDGHLEAVSLLPVAGPSSSRSVPKLPSLQIPEYSIPSARRQSRSKSPAQRTPDVHDPSYDSDDSASLYSQASASTLRTTKSYATTRHSTMQTIQYPSMLLPSIPQSPSNKPPVPIRTGEPMRESVAALQNPPEFNLGQDSREEDSNGGLGAEETLLVAKLLQSRQSRVPNAAPTRNSSIVSHIERADSIKPALGRGAGSRFKRAKRARDMVKSQVLAHSPVDHTASTTYSTSGATTSVPSQSPTTTGVAPLNIIKATRTE